MKYNWLTDNSTYIDKEHMCVLSFKQGGFTLVLTFLSSIIVQCSVVEFWVILSQIMHMNYIHLI